MTEQKSAESSSRTASDSQSQTTSDSQSQVSSEVESSARETPLNQTAAAESTETTSWRFDGIPEDCITFDRVDLSDSE